MRKRNKQAISLIVLVITVIVMIILSGAIVLTLNNSGIISKANEAVKETNDATIKELAQTAWAEAYMNGAKTDEKIKEAVETILEKNGIDVDEYGIVATINGVNIAKGWLQDGLSVVKGDKVLKIGDDFDYDETAEETKDVTWKVLGANNEGELLIMSTSDVVSSHPLGAETDSKDIYEAANDWVNGTTELDSLCEPYGKGKNATGARSITVEDVNKITGYNPKTAKYEKGKAWEYGNEITYSYAGKAGIIKYYSEVTKPEKETSCSTFYYLDKTNRLVQADLAKGTGIITKLRSDSYLYDVKELKTIDATNQAYEMLFGKDDKCYWLASPCIHTESHNVWFGMRIVYWGDVDFCNSLYSNGNCFIHSFGVRAVVSLSPDIQVSGSSETGWTY